MLKIKNNYFEIFFAGFVGLVFGIIINKIIINFPFFVVDKNLNLFQLLSICSPIVVAIYINAIINKNNEMNSQSKKIFIDKLNETDSIIENLMDFVETKSFDFYKFINITTRIIRCFKLMKSYKIYTGEEYADYMESILEIKNAATGEGIVIDNGIITIKSTVLSDITNSMYELRNKVFEKKLQIIQEATEGNSKKGK